MRPSILFLLLLVGCVLLPASGVHARALAGDVCIAAPLPLPDPQTGGDDDSLARAAERARLEEEIATVRDELYTLRDQAADADSTAAAARRERIAALESRLDVLEEQLDALTFAGARDDWWTEDDWDEASPDWWDEDGDFGQFTPRPDVFRKYPSYFRWFFPVDSRLGESFLRYNRAEGLYLGIAQPRRLYWHSKPRLVSTGSLGYGFASHRWRYSLGLYVPIYLSDQIIEIGGEGHSLTDSKDQWTIDRDENTAMAFFGKEDFMDYFGREGFSASVSWYLRAEDNVNLRASLAYVHDTYRSVARNTNWSLFGGDKRFRDVPAVADININSIVASAGFGTVPSLSPALHGWTVTVLAELAGEALKGDATFTQLTIDARRYQPLADFLSLNVRGRFVASDGDIPAQRLFEIGGPGTLPGFRYKEFGGTHGMLVNAELILRGHLLRGDTRGWLSSFVTGINLILFADAGVASSAPVVILPAGASVEGASLVDDIRFSNWRSDVGIALGNSDGDFRIGVAWRTDRSENPSLVLRFSRPF